MTTTFHIEPNELNEGFLQKIKSIFGEKKLLISIEEDDDETAYLLSTISNRRKFAKSLSELEKGEVVSQTLEELRK